MKADLLYLGAGYTVSRSKPFQGGGNVTGTETVPEPKLSQISNNCHNCLNRATRDQGSFNEVHLNNHKKVWHETNLHRRPAQPFITGAWNYKKIFTEEEVMNFISWRFPSPFSCEYQPLEEDFNPTMKRPSQDSSMGFKSSVLAFQEARNQKNWSRENQDAINFLKPAKLTSIWESFQPTRFGLTQAYPWKPGDTLDHSEDTQDVHRCTSTQRIRRILLTIYFPYPATPYAFKESCLHLMSKDQRLYSFEPEETKILKSLISSQRLIFRGYFSKISRYKISLLQRQQISLTASSHGAIKAIDSKHFISIDFLSLVHFQTVRESLVEPIKL
ncbi:hypothetical protein YC2023_094752 [Brassica napus]